jgi:hypothetical protein
MSGPYGFTFINDSSNLKLNLPSLKARAVSSAKMGTTSAGFLLTAETRTTTKTRLN